MLLDLSFKIYDLEFDYNSIVIISYLLLSFFALILNKITLKKSNRLLFECYRSSPLNPLTYVRLFTHSIGHAGFEHFLHNFLLILLVGPMIEEKYGSINLLIMLLTTSLVIGLFNVIFTNQRLCGASGNVYMLIVLSSFSNIQDGKIPITVILICIFYIVGEIKDFIVDRKSNTSHGGHLLGALCGLLFGIYFLYFNKFPFI